MAQKEAVAIILDVGLHMDQLVEEGNLSKLQESLSCIDMILQRKLFSESKDEVALIMLGSDETANDLAKGENDYQHISLARPLSIVTWPFLDFIQNDIVGTTHESDFLDALVVAADHLRTSTLGKKFFVSNKILLFTDLSSPFNDDQLEVIINSLKNMNIMLNVIGVNMDDIDNDADEPMNDNGIDRESQTKRFNSNNYQKPKSEQQKLGGKVIQTILKDIDGECYTFSETWDFMSNYQSRSVKPVAWKCQLEITEEIQIPLNGYIRVKETKSKTFKTVFAKDPDVKLTRDATHNLNDDTETEIEKKDIVKGHRYGRTLVPFSDEDLSAMKYKCFKCLQVLGFTSNNNVHHSMYMSDNTMIFQAENGDHVSSTVLSALIQACEEMKMVIIVRRCYSAASTPRIGVLEPYVDNVKHRERLYYHELPFAEDMRRFILGTLPVSEETTKDYNAKSKPSENQLELFDNLIISMMLTSKNENGDIIEEKKPKTIFNPYLQRLFHCLNHRVIKPNDPLPETNKCIIENINPPKWIIDRAKPVLEEINNSFTLKRISKAKEQTTAQDLFNIAKDDAENGSDNTVKKSKIDDDTNQDVNKEEISTIGTVSPVQDFLFILKLKDFDHYDDACKMMQERIFQLIFDSFGTQLFNKAIDCITIYREQSIKHSESNDFNNFLRKLKQSLLTKNKLEFWKLIVSKKLGLIMKLESEESVVSKNDAEEFLQENTTEKQTEIVDHDADELLDMI